MIKVKHKVCGYVEDAPHWRREAEGDFYSIKDAECNIDKKTFIKMKLLGLGSIICRNNAPGDPTWYSCDWGDEHISTWELVPDDE